MHMCVKIYRCVYKICVQIYNHSNCDERITHCAFDMDCFCGDEAELSQVFVSSLSAFFKIPIHSLSSFSNWVACLFGVQVF